MKDNDKEFIRMLENVKEIPLKKLEPWYRGDDNRQEMVATALANGKVGFRTADSLSGRGTFDNKLLNMPTQCDMWSPGPATGYKRVEMIKEFMSSSGLYWPFHFMVEAASLKKWIDNTFQPVPDSPKGFMSERLRIAVEISKKLYSNGYKVTRGRTSYSAEKERIDKELDKANIKSKSDLKEWMQKIINPEPWR